MFHKHNMPKVRDNYFASITTLDSEKFGHYFVALEDEAGRHTYRATGECSLREAKQFARDAFRYTTATSAVYLYPAYCKICSPDHECDMPHRHTLEPATHLDHITKYTR